MNETHTPMTTDAREDLNGEDLFAQLQAQVTLGEEMTDPRLGKYDDALLTTVELSHTGKGDPVVLMTWGGMTDSNGQVFELTARENIPSPESHPVSQRIFLAMLHDLGIVPRSHKKAILAADEAQAEAIVNAIKTVAEKGLPWAIQITDDNGFLRVRLRRQIRR